MRERTFLLPLLFAAVLHTHAQDARERWAGQEFAIADTISIGGSRVLPHNVPEGLELHKDLGLLAPPSVEGQIVHRTAYPVVSIYETRAVVTPKGDYLLMFPEGEHYGGKHISSNRMVAYRSKDKGQTWRGPSYPFDIDYNQHGFVPLIPRGSSRIYAFGTQPVWDHFERPENAPIGYRYSDDDGYTWSDVQLIRPGNDPEFKGMSVMRMTETDRGTWLIGAIRARPFSRLKTA